MISPFRRRREREELDELLSAYLDGELSEREQADMDARLSRDPALRAELRAMHGTVSLLRELPPVAPPRNFLLTPSMVKARGVEVEARATPQETRARGWMAPVLTAATGVVSLLFAVVLVGDLLLPGIGGLASSSAPLRELAAPKEVVLEMAPADEAEAPDQERAVDAEVLREPASSPPPTVEMESLVEEAPEEEEADIAATHTAATRAAEAPPGAGATPPPAGEDIGTEEAAPLTVTPVSPTIATADDVTTTIPREAELERPAPSPEEDVGPNLEREQEETAAIRLSPRGWITLQISLGLASVGLAIVTIRAWRRRKGRS